MNILLLSMPDYFEHMPAVAVRMPNGALTSLAGNVDRHHRVAVADLILCHGRVRETITRLVRERIPDVVGLSVMTFQRRTSSRIIRLLRELAPDVKIVVGGYDPSLAPEAYEQVGVDFIVRGEGEITFRDLTRCLENAADVSGIPGLSYTRGEHWVHNPDRPVHRLEDGEIKLPNRDARVLKGYTALGRQVDVVETSRGCTFDCSFCSIIEMRGRNFHTYSFERVLADIRDAVDHGARTIFLVDDNITLNVHRFEALCRSIIEAGLNKLDYFVQAMTSVIATHGQILAPLMRRAGFRYVFLGIENVLQNDLVFFRATAKNTVRENGEGPAQNATLRAIDHLHRNKMYVIGGLIVGSPDDTVDSIEANLNFARRHIDWPYIQHPTPYPRTAMTEDLRKRNLIVNQRFEEYDGTTAVVRSKHVTADDMEYIRWNADRWMKLRHMPVAFRHDPWFILRHAPEMLAHTFRGCTLLSIVGLKSTRDAFNRYKTIRCQEREYL